MTSLNKIMDYFTISLRNISKRKTRSWLTMIGIFIGIAAVVALISLGQGLKGAIHEEFNKLGMDKVFISSAGSTFGMGGTNSLSEHDVTIIKKVKGISIVTSDVFTTAQIQWKEENWWNVVIGLSTDKKEQQLLNELFPLEEGRWLRKGDTHKAIIGYDYSHSPAFKKKLFLGDHFTINGQEFEVIGTFKKVGDSTDDRMIAIPRSVERELFSIPQRLDAIIVKTKPGADPDAVATAIEKEMRKDRGQKEGEEDFTVQTFKELIKGFLVILDIVTTVLIGIAAISLIIGTIGIMNTMYTSVLERTREIGIMKAVGATNNDVLALFLIESGLLGLAGGIVGILIGAGLASIAAYLAQTVGGFEYLKAYFPFWLISGALLFSFIIGILAGVLPASQAAKKNPVDSLRYE